MSSGDAALLLHRRFEARACQTPDAVALLEAGRSITCAALDAHADRIARALCAAGIGGGGMVGLHVERSAAWVAGVLGILKSGAAVVPLPPSYPAGRLREILDYAGLDAVLDDAASPLDPSLGARVLRLPDAGGDVTEPPASAAGAAAEADSPAADAAAADPDRPAFVLCSSGSTGRPKMIVRSHRSFFHRLDWTWDRHPYAADEVCCQKAHMTTTHAIYELFEPLLGGVPVVIVPDDVVRDLERFWDEVRARGVTRLLIVPSVLRASLDMPGFAPPPLRVVVLMGEYVHPALAARAVAAFPVATALYSIYGSTEASSTLVCDLRAVSRPGAELPLGEPIAPDIEALVLGPDLAPVAAGEAGRLYMAGPALFAGYFRDPDLTASVLLRVPGRAAPVYDTRDAVRRTVDGGLHFVGRVDHTVKVRGFRVDLGEVERVLQAQVSVRQAAVVASGAGAGSAALLAFVTPATVDRAALFDALRAALPAYMLPSVLVGVDAFPLTASGKVDRVRLREAHAARTREEAEAPADAGLDATGRRVAAAWADVLGQAGFGPDANFFEVGGTSLTVLTLVHRLRDAFGLDRSRVDEQLVYRLPTLAAQAAHIAALAAGRAVAAMPETPVAVVLRRGGQSDRPPFFAIASSGGTLGAYEKLARALTTPCELVGIRDPLLWGDRDAGEGFDAWVGRYVDAILAHRPDGPLRVIAYSSAGAFGCEAAHRLRAAGRDVALLVLIDPLGLDRRSRGRYGYWVSRATYAARPMLEAIRLAGWLRRPVHPLLRAFGRRTAARIDAEPAPAAAPDLAFVLSLAALFELNTGLPFALDEADFAGVPADTYLSVLTDRAARLAPELDAATVERIAVQYPLQVRAQQQYALRPYDGPVLLVEPATRYAGLIRAQLRPYVPRLRSVTLPVGPPTDRERALSGRFGAWGTHFRSMRDDQFVQALARELDALPD